MYTVSIINQEFAYVPEGRGGRTVVDVSLMGNGKHFHWIFTGKHYVKYTCMMSLLAAEMP